MFVVNFQTCSEAVEEARDLIKGFGVTSYESFFEALLYLFLRTNFVTERAFIFQTGAITSVRR